MGLVIKPGTPSNPPPARPPSEPRLVAPAPGSLIARGLLPLEPIGPLALLLQLLLLPLLFWLGSKERPLAGRAKGCKLCGEA